jgi:hypothetical protein
MSPGSLETARPSVTGATHGSCESDHDHSCGERFKGKVFLWSSPTWRATFRRSLAELRRSSKSSSELAVHAVVSLERLLMARSGQGANFRFGQEHRTFLSVSEFHYLTHCGVSERWNTCLTERIIPWVLNSISHASHNSGFSTHDPARLIIWFSSKLTACHNHASSQSRSPRAPPKRRANQARLVRHERLMHIIPTSRHSLGFLVNHLGVIRSH